MKASRHKYKYRERMGRSRNLATTLFKPRRRGRKSYVKVLHYQNPAKPRRRTPTKRRRSISRRGR